MKATRFRYASRDAPRAVDQYSALRAGIFKAWGSTDPMRLGRARNRTFRAPIIVSMSPPGYPSAWLLPSSAAFVSPGTDILAFTIRSPPGG